jgi:EAL domain-containing protein (putative c-di-GMP-specific phosphodiesterase class I)/CheY-like chemotaxis protein
MPRDSAGPDQEGKGAVGEAGARILVADGPDSHLSSAKAAIEGAGFRVDLVGDGVAVQTHLASTRYDVLLADVALSELDPLALLRAVRRRDLDVPLILASDATRAGLAAVAVEQGALCQLAKPVPAGLLVEKLGYASKLHALARLRRRALDTLGGQWSQMGDRAALEVAFERAFDRLSIAFQPIVSWSSRRVIGHEALLRSSDPQLPDPVSVLAVAERLSRIDQIGRLVRERVARSMAKAPAEYVFVNLHPHEMLDGDLFSDTAPLSQFAKRIVLEISEHALLDDIEHLESRAEALRRLGFRLAMDNLGPGYPGLSSFARLRPEFVKYDLSLVRGADLRPEQGEILAAMTSLFASMNTRVIAAGIESIAERDAMLRAGVDLLQGYAFSRPASGYGQPVVG